MTGQHGGYRQPANPAPVSGPGAHSQRTDGGVAHQALSAVPDQPYGDAKAQMDSQRQAPMAGAAPLPKPAPVPQGGGGAPQGGASAGLDLLGPTARPDEPITSGVDIGDGPGSDALPLQPVNLAQGTGKMTALLTRLSNTDATGILATLAQRAQAYGA